MKVQKNQKNFLEKNKLINSCILGISCFILVAMICIQIKTVKNQKTGTISSDRETNQLRAEVLKQEEKYNNKENELENNLKILEKLRQENSDKNEELKKLEEQITIDNNLVGFNSVEGTGIILNVSDSKKSINSYSGDVKLLLVHYSDLIAIINELVNAGAQAISINGQRIVNTSGINCAGNIITVNGKKIGSPFEIKAIGNTNSLMNLNRPQGILDLLKKDGLEVSIKSDEKVKIDKYTGTFEFKYLRKVD